jgi:hypothetical protein
LYRTNWLKLQPLPQITTLQNSFLLTGLLEVVQMKHDEAAKAVESYSLGLIIVTVSVSVLICIFFVLVYVPLVAAMDQGMKRTRSLLLLFPEDALMYVPSLKKAMRSAARSELTPVSGRSAHSASAGRLRKYRNVSRVFPS